MEENRELKNTDFETEQPDNSFRSKRLYKNFIFPIIIYICEITMGVVLCHFFGIVHGIILFYFVSFSINHLWMSSKIRKNQKKSEEIKAQEVNNLSESMGMAVNVQALRLLLKKMDLGN